MYDPALVQPMREELSTLGIQELKTPEEVDQALSGDQDTALVVINSVCGCAAGAARPAVALALKNSVLPSKLTTVFAGQDKEATQQARGYLPGMPASSPSIALLKGGQVAFMLHRQDIEGKTAEQISEELKGAFQEFC